MTDTKKPLVTSPTTETAERHALDETTIQAVSPESAGVITLFDAAAEILKVEFTKDIRATLIQYATKGPLQPDVVRRAARFDFVPTDDPRVAASRFDEIVNGSGVYPACQPLAPEGSKYQGQQDPRAKTATELDALVTRYDQFTDTELLDRVRESLEEEPENTDLQETYAFLLYSSGSLDEAIKRYEGLAQSEEAKAIHHFYLGNAYYKKKRIDDAILQWGEVVKLSPRSRAGLKAARRRRKAQDLVGSAA